MKKLFNASKQNPYLCHPQFNWNGSVVQLVRMPPCHGGGRGFESRPVRKGSEKLRAFFMPYYVYIIQSGKDASYYKGYSEHPFLRLQQHNNKESHYTSDKVPWHLIFIQSFFTKREALIRERVLKKYSHNQIEKLIVSNLNELKNLIG